MACSIWVMASAAGGGGVARAGALPSRSQLAGDRAQPHGEPLRVRHRLGRRAGQRPHQPRGRDRERPRRGERPLDTTQRHPLGRLVVQDEQVHHQRLAVARGHGVGRRVRQLARCLTRRHPPAVALGAPEREADGQRDERADQLVLDAVVQEVALVAAAGEQQPDRHGDPADGRAVVDGHEQEPGEQEREAERQRQRAVVGDERDERHGDDDPGERAGDAGQRAVPIPGDRRVEDDDDGEDRPVGAAEVEQAGGETGGAGSHRQAHGAAEDGVGGPEREAESLRRGGQVAQRARGVGEQPPPLGHREDDRGGQHVDRPRGEDGEAAIERCGVAERLAGGVREGDQQRGLQRGGQRADTRQERRGEGGDREADGDQRGRARQRRGDHHRGGDRDAGQRRAEHPCAWRPGRRRHAEEDRRDERVAGELGSPGDPEAHADRDDGEDAAAPGGDDHRGDRAQPLHVPEANMRRWTT